MGEWGSGGVSEWRSLGVEQERQAWIARRFRELRVYRVAFDAAMRVFELSKSWPAEEKFSLTDQIRRSSRAVCGAVAEAWRKRRYPKHFASKLTDADSESAETRA